MGEGEAYSDFGLQTKYRALTDAFSIQGDYTHFYKGTKSNSWGEFLSGTTIPEEEFFKILDFFETLRRGK